jgi:hypothetical protein
VLGPTSTDAVVHVQVLLGLVPGLVTPPAAALTAKASVQAGSAAIGLFNADAASGGATVHAGALVNAPNARLGTVAGGAVALSVIEADAALQAASTDRFFASFFGVDKALWQQHPGVTHLRCSTDCASALAQALGTGTSHRLLWVDGDARVDSPVVLGTPQRPIMVIVNGTLTLGAGVTIHGLVYATRLVWNDAPAGTAAVHGAAISEGDYQGSGAPDFMYDSALLASLKTSTGSFARVPGSWRDF